MRNGWQTMTIGDVADITDYVANGSFATLRENVSYKNTKDYAILVRLADYTSGFDESRFVYVDKHSYDFLAKSKLFGGEIIMSNVGSIGKLFLCPDLGMPMSLAPNSIVIKTANNPFYYYLLSSPHYQNLIQSISSTTALPKFNKTSFKKIPVSIPPCPEQQRIVAEFDLLSGILEKQRLQLKELDTLAKSVFYGLFGNPELNERGWRTSSLGDACISITDGSHNPPKGGTKSPYLMLSSKNVQDGHLSFDDPRYLQADEYSTEHKRTNVKTGDILLTIVGTVGRCCIFESTKNVVFQRSVAVLKPQESFNNVFMMYQIMLLRGVLENEAKGVAQKGIYLKQLGKIRLIAPPRSLQEQFATKIKAIEHQKALINQSLVETQKLFDYTMDKYFG